MLKIVVHLAVRTEEQDLDKIAAELRRRIETQPALRADAIKAIVVLNIERTPEQVQERPSNPNGD